MLVAYKLWGSANPDMVPIGMPLEVPWMNSFIEDAESDHYKKKGYLVVTEEEYATYIESVSGAVDVYLASKEELENLKYVKDAVNEAVKFGHNLIVEYGAKNTLRGYTSEDIASVATTLSGVSMLLSSGALYTALGVISGIEVTSLVTQADKDEFIAKISTYLGLE